MAIVFFFPLLATAGAATSATLVRAATTGRLRRTQGTRTAPTTSTSARAAPAGTTTAATTVKAFAPSQIRKAYIITFPSPLSNEDTECSFTPTNFIHVVLETLYLSILGVHSRLSRRLLWLLLNLEKNLYMDRACQSCNLPLPIP